MLPASVPYLLRLQVKEGVADGVDYPFSLPLIRCLDVEFTSPVTFFVGENGTGPSSRRYSTRAVPTLTSTGDPYGRYGGRSLQTRSHGEAFLAIP